MNNRSIELIQVKSKKSIIIDFINNQKFIF